MAVLLESPWYREILELGEARGEAISQFRAQLEGEIKGLLKGVELALELKFGAAGLDLLAEISQITDIDKLAEIYDRLKTAKNLTQIRQVYRPKKTR